MTQAVSMVLGGLGMGLMGKLAGKPPKPPPTVEMPDPEDQAKARKKALVEMMTRSGRSSTMLTDQSQKLGG